jgi:hypothetical protein
VLIGDIDVRFDRQARNRNGVLEGWLAAASCKLQAAGDSSPRFLSSSNTRDTLEHTSPKCTELPQRAQASATASSAPQGDRENGFCKGR